MKLSASNEELKKKNSILMISSLGAAGLALIAFIIAIVAAATPSVSPAQFNELESGVVALQSDVDEIGKNADEEKYDDIESAIVYDFLSDYIEKDLLNTIYNNELSDEEKAAIYKNANAYLLASYEKLSDNEQKVIGNLLFTVINGYGKEDAKALIALEALLQKDYDKIFDVYSNSDSYTIAETLEEFEKRNETFNTAANEVIDFVPTADNKDDYEEVKNKYNTDLDNVKNYYNEHQDLLKDLSIPENEVASAKIKELDYYFAGPFDITFFVSKDNTPKTTLNNDDIFVSEETETNKNVIPSINVEDIGENKKFVGWATTKTPAEESACYTDKELTGSSVYDLFKDNDDNNDKKISLYPIIVEDREYTVTIDDKSFSIRWPFHVLTADEITETPDLKNDPFTSTDDNKTFKGYKKVTKNENGEENLEETLYDSDYFLGKTVAEVEGTYKADYENHVFINFKNPDGNIVLSYDNTGDTKIEQEIINEINNKLGDKVSVYAENNKESEKINLDKYVNQKLSSIIGADKESLDLFVIEKSNETTIPSTGIGDEITNKS